MSGEKRHILLLAGTREARCFAHLAAREARLRLTASMAGDSPAPKPFPCPCRRKGFGGVAGLKGWMKTARIDALVNATHPFAASMSAHAAEACDALGLPCLRLLRPPWEIPSPTGWRALASLEEAAEILPAGARVFLPLGAKHLQPFAARKDVWFAVRTLAPLSGSSFPDEIIIAAPPFSLSEEIALLTRLRITHMVARNSGGESGFTKIAAARETGVRILMVHRPGIPCGALAASPEAAFAWVRRILDMA